MAAPVSVDELVAQNVPRWGRIPFQGRAEAVELAAPPEEPPDEPPAGDGVGYQNCQRRPIWYVAAACRLMNFCSSGTFP